MVIYCNFNREHNVFISQYEQYTIDLKRDYKTRRSNNKMIQHHSVELGVMGMLRQYFYHENDMRE